jgi:hypothetical protein
MGRGLSELQRYILAEAAERDRLDHAEILAGYFGWQGRPGRNHSSRVGQGGFSRAGIGEQIYRKVMATLSRACRRLAQRGLVTCVRPQKMQRDNQVTVFLETTCGKSEIKRIKVPAHGAGVAITARGRKMLSVNSFSAADGK